jgi:hypothetical protein
MSGSACRCRLELMDLAVVLLVNTRFRPLLGIESAQTKERSRAIPKDASTAATASSRRIQAMVRDMDRFHRIF